MKILGIDSSSISCSVGVWDSEKNPKEISGKIINNGLTHSQTLLPMIDEVLKDAQITAKDVDLIAITKGPGSFTGLRIGMATAKGLAAPFDTPCVCVSTLEAIAYTACQQHEGVFCAVMDARCNQVYNALFEKHGDELIRICEDRAITIEDLNKELKDLNKSVVLCGDGVEVCKKNFKDIDYEIADEEVRFPHGVAVCALGEKYKNEALSPDKISPVYLRLPQASRELLKKKEVKK